MRGIFITVRSDSKRLPQKAVKKIRGITVIEYLIGRMKNVGLDAEICICTTVLPEDNIFDKIAEKADVKVFHGSAENILLRQCDCAKSLGVDFIVNVDGDDVFCSPDAVSRVIGAFDANPHTYDIIKTTGFPFGTNATGYGLNVIKKILSANAGKRIETGWGEMMGNKNVFNIFEIRPSDEEKDEIRLTLDYEEDFLVFKTLIEAMEMDKRYASQTEILAYIKANPHIREINAHLKEMYFDNLYQKQQEEGHGVE